MGEIIINEKNEEQSQIKLILLFSFNSKEIIFKSLRSENDSKDTKVKMRNVLKKVI